MINCNVSCLVTLELGILHLLLIALVGISCEKSSQLIPVVSNGGVMVDDMLCPDVYNDVIIPLSDLSEGDMSGYPEMTFQGIMKYMEQEGIVTITALLNKLPPYYRNNFSLVEHTKGEGQSNLTFPRIVLFGPDGRFMLNVGTKPDDPKYNLLDGAELDAATGEWVFSQLDFTGKKPVLIDRPLECNRCHGSSDPRPVWGTSLDWPGVFGDNEAPGLTGDALSESHLNRINEIRSGNGGSDRFDFLEWKKEETLRFGGFRRIADHAFGAELLVSNLVMGAATGRGAFLRMKHRKPEAYEDLKEALLLLAYQERGYQVLSQYDYDRIVSKLNDYGMGDISVNGIFGVMGVNVFEAFSLGTLAEEEKPDPSWSLGDGDLYEQVYLQVLEDLSRSDPKVREILESTSAELPIFNCPDIANNIQELVDYKMLHLYQLKGHARFEVNKHYYPLEVERIFDVVLAPVVKELTAHLAAKI